ncbi:MAG TPA: invasion associated locus B family protein [Gammaproteobacteria bacterium]
MKKGRSVRRGARVLLVTLLALVALPVQAAETRRENFGDWGFICSTPEGQEDANAKQGESCNLFQTALLNTDESEGPGQRVLLTRVGYLDSSENPVLLVTAPLGILLPMGITVEVEGHDAIRIPVQRCDAGGCLAYVVMEQPFIEAFKKGIEAKVTLYDAKRRGVAIPLSLKGFTDGMAALAESRGK